MNSLYAFFLGNIHLVVSDLALDQRSVLLPVNSNKDQVSLREFRILTALIRNLIKQQCASMPKGGNRMIKRLIVLAVLAIALVGMAGAANYMYEKASVK